jgi:hypothetical protein
MSKTLGQVAYEAYWTTVSIDMGREPTHNWESLPDTKWRGKQAWEAAAEAVAHKTATAFTQRWEGERAVIEAACAYVSEYRKPYRPSTGHAYQALMKAVQALEAAEKSDG